MTRLVARSVQTLAVSVVLLCAGASAALAGPKPIDPEFPAPASVPAADQGFDVQLRWMLDGAAVLLAAAAVALVVVLWHRSHSAARRVAIH
jgi:hypothetical protein